MRLIKGIGTDLCSISRMKQAISRKGFKERVFSAEEISYAQSFACPEEHFAAAFAAREALGKALGTGLAKTMSVSVRRTDTGPQFVFVQEILPKGTKVFLSISHEEDFAIAFVVIEGI